MNFSKKLKFAFTFSAFSLSFLTVASPAKNDLKKTFFTLDDGESISTVMAAPINITNNTSVTSTFSVMLLNDVLDGGLTGTTITDDHVSKTWVVQSSSATTSGSGIDLELTWDASDEVGTPSSYDVVVYNEQQNSWARLNGNLGSVQTSGSTKTLSITGVTEDFTSPLMLAVAPAPAPPAPAITSFTPASGEVGDVVTIAGSGFSTVASNNIVFFGGVRATVTGASASQLTVTVPAGAQDGPITITTNGYSVETELAFCTSSSTVAAFSLNSAGFGSAVNFSSIQNTYTWYENDNFLVVADFNNDGKNDIGKLGSNSVRVHKNTSSTVGVINSSSFDAGTTFNLNNSAHYSIVAKDINNDGLTDIIGLSAGVVSVLVNNTTVGSSTISFATVQTFTVANYKYELEVADFDGDGKFDLFIQSNYTQPVNNSTWNSVIYLNTTSSGSTVSFAAGFQLTTNQGSRECMVSDLNGDGLPDIVESNNGKVRINTSTSGSLSFNSFNMSFDSDLVIAFDVDQDGDNDIVSGKGTVYVNNISNPSAVTSADFSAVTMSATAGGNKGDKMAYGDYNGDGKLDFLINESSAYGSPFQFYLNDFSGTVSSSTFSKISKLYVYGDAAFFDVDGDEAKDVILLNSGSSNFTVVQNMMMYLPNLTVSGSLNSFDKCESVASAQQSLTLSGSNLTANVLVPSNTNLEYSIDGGSTWNASLTIAPTSGIVSETLLVRAKSAVNSDVSTTSFSISSTGATSVAVSYEIDVLTPPAVANATISTPSGTAISYTPTVTNGVSNAMYTWTVASANSNVTGEVANSTPSYTFDATLTSTTAVQEQVTYTVTPYTETPGSCPGTPFTLTVTVNPVPTLSSASSLSGYVTEEITLTGTNLSYITSVLVGGQSATFTVNSSTEIVFEVPQNSTGSIVVSDGVSSASLTGFTYLVATTASSVPTASAEGITWYDLMFGSNWDPLDDQQAVAETDLVGDANNVLTQVGSSKMIINGQALDDYYYFRTRMGEADPKTSIYLGLDLDGDNLADVFVEANNKAQTPYVAYHIADPTKSGVSPSQTGWLNSTNNTNVELQLTGSESQITRYTTGADMENTNQSDDDDWVEWAFSEESLKSFASNALSLNIDGNSAIALFLFTSTSQTANGDIAGIDDNTADLTTSWSDLGIVIYASLNSVSSGEIITPTVTTLSTTNSTPTISGFWGGDQGGGDVISIVFNGITYTTSSPELTLNNNAWSITLTSANALVNSGSYDVAVSVTRGGTTVTDETTNEITFTSDAVAPVALAQDITLPLDASGNGSITTSDIDNGTTDNSGSFTLSLDITSFTCADLGANTVTLTATDGAGNTSSATATVTVVDNIAPTITAPAAVTVNADAGVCSTALTNVTLGTATTADNCSVASTTNNAPTSFPLGATTVTWTVTDGSGNTATATQVVTVEDNIDPVAVAQNITVSLDANGTASITTADVDNGSSDNCSYTLALDATSFDCDDVGANTVTLTATDGSGNTHSTTATVTVEDNTIPTITAPAAVTVNVDAGACSTALTNVTLGTPTTADNCSVASTTSDAPTSFPLGATTVTWTVTDGSGNTATATQVVTVEDNTVPTITAPAAVTVNVDAGACSAALTNVTLGTATTADNCSVASTTNDAPTSFPLGATTVTWTVTDGSGNTATATQVVTVEDNTDPVAVAQNITVSLDANGTASITTADVDNGSSDNCSYTLALDVTSFDCDDVGANTVTLTATDGSGNTHSTTATVTVEDNIDPVAVAQNITVSLDANGTASITTADVDNGSSDNCSYTLALDVTSFDCDDVGANTVTLTATDASGNTSSATATVTVEDNLPPTVNTVASFTAVLDANGQYTVTESDIITSKSDVCTTTPTISLSNNTFTCSDIGGAGWTSSTATNASNYSRLAFYDDNGTWYAIGIDQSDKWVILQWNGTDWSLSNTSSMSANSANGIWPIEMVKDANGDFIYFYQYTGGPGYIYAVKYDGSSWSDFITGSTNSSYAIRKQNGGDNDVYVDGSGNVYWSVVSYSTSYNQYPLKVMKWDGTNFTAYPTQTQGYVEVGLADDGNGNPSVTINNTLYTVTSSGWTNEGTVSSWSGTPWYTQLYRASNGDLYAASYQGTVSGYVFDIKLDYLPNGGSWSSLLSTTVQKPTSANYSYFDDMLDFGIVNSNVALLANSGTSSAFEVRVYNAGVQVGSTLSSTRIPTNTANKNDFNPTLLGTGSSFIIATTNYDAWNTTVDNYSSAQFVSYTATDAQGNTTTGTVPVTVVDQTAPSTVAQNVTVQLDGAGNASVSVNQVDNGTTDNCSATLSFDAAGALTSINYTTSDLGANNVTLYGTDPSGNQSSQTAVVTVVDQTSPTVITQDVTVYLDANGLATITTSDIDNGTTDNSGTPTLSLDITSFDCDDVGANTVTLTATDGSGNTSSATAIVTVVDNTSPTIVAQNITVSLDANGTASITTADVDNGSSDNCSFTLALDVTSFDCSDVGANTVTLTATDGSGNTHSTTATVTVEDNTVPTITAPAAVTVNVDAGACSTALTNVTLGTPTTADNCSVASTTNDAPTSFPLGATTVTWTVTDGSGNTATATQVVTVEDNIDPVAVAQNITVSLDANGTASITTADVDNGSSDNCSYTLSLDVSSFDCDDVGANTVTLTATDGSGNTHSTTSTVTVEDNIDPVAVAQNITVSLDANGTASITTADVDNGSSDNCSYTLSLDVTSFDCDDVGANTVTLTATDGSGNTHSTTATVTVQDDIDPTITAPAAVTVNVDAGSCSAALTNVTLGTPTTADNCSVASTTNDAPTSFPLGATTVTWTVTDGSGNTATATQVVTVEDNTVPTITAPAAVTVNVDAGACSAALTNVTLGTATTADNCSVASTTNDAPTSFPLGATTVTWTVTDGSGNTATATQVVTVEDNIDPVAVAQNITVSLDANGTASITTADVDNGSSDNCSYTLSLDVTSFDCDDVGANTVTLTATDGSGNTHSTTATVTVEDNIDPVAVAQNITVSLDANGTASITTADVDNGSSDNCSYTLALDATSFDCDDVGANTVTLTATDGSGNTHSTTATVTVEDNTIPTITAPAAVTVNVDAGACSTALTNVTLGTPTTADNCSVASTTSDAPTSFPLGATTVTWTVTDGSGNTATATQVVTVEDNTVPTITAPAAVTVNVDAGACSAALTNVTLGTATTADNCSVASTTNDAPTSFPLGATTVTWTVTDGSGNTATATQVVTVEDNTDPTITAPAAVTVNVDAGACSTALTNVTLGTATTADNCSVASTTNDAPTSFPLGNTTVTWTVTDGSGNTATATQVVTVEDNLDPVLSCPSNMVVYCAADSTLTSVSWSAATATDNCSLDTVFSDVQIGTFLPLGTTVVTYVAIDGSGNTDTCSFNISVVDTVSPVITGCPSPITQNNDTDSCGAQVVWSSPSYYDNSGYFTVTASHTSGDYFPVGTTTVAITVADTSGNSAVCEFDVVVTDNQIPNVLPYNNVAITLGTDGMYSLSAAAVDSASYDNCSIANRYLTNSFFNCNDVPSANTWLVIEDIHGNKDSALVPVQVSLPATPVLSVLPTINDVLCFGGSTGSIQTAVSGGVAPYTYNWSNGSTTFDAANLSIGSYWYEVTDTNGCYTTDTLLVNQPAPLTASTVKSIYPGGYNVSINGTNDGSITTTASGGIMPYTFDWNNGAFTTQNLTAIPAGVYALVMTDSNGCEYSLADTLTEPTRLVATATSLQSVICPDDTTGIVLAAASGAVPPYSYSWDFGSTTDYNTGLSYGIYTVTVTDTNGATATDTVLVDALDYDCDGIYNVDEGGAPNGGGGNGDIDGDGIPNEEDEDSDGDGLPDSEEFDYDNDGVGFDDCDGDGIPNFLDPDLCDLLVPAVFTPNGDGDNDYWEIMGIGAFPDNNVKVFNRWGELVYFKEGYNNEFNGRANTRTQMNGGDGLLPTGTYYYVVKVYETGDTYTGYVYITK